jgi:hypothetical protein
MSSEYRGYGYTRGFCTGFATGTGTGTEICTRTRTCTRGAYYCLPVMADVLKN